MADNLPPRSRDSASDSRSEGEAGRVANEPSRSTGPLPEETLGWELDRKSALFEVSFRYPAQRSFFNGVNDKSNEHLRNYLDLRAQLAAARRKVNQLAQRLASYRAQSNNLNETRILQEREEAAIDVQRLELREQEIKRRVGERKSRILDLQRRLHERVPGLSLPVVLLFLIGFFLFAAADFGIAHNIAYSVLDFDEREAIIFAISIACIPLIVKPFVERYVEEPHHADPAGRPKLTRRFYTVIMVLVVIYLGVFGCGSISGRNS